MSKNVVIAGVVIIVLGLAGWYFMSSKKSSTTPVPVEVTQTPTPTEVPTPSASASAKMEKNVVKITSAGFSPKSITIKAGESVTWMNNDSENHTVNSDKHPTHLLYPFLNVGLVKPGGTESVTISKTGTFTYHDHLNPSLKGSITVE